VSGFFGFWPSRSRASCDGGWVTRMSELPNRPRPPRSDRARPSSAAGLDRIGGGNRAIIGAFDARQRRCRAFIAHDLDSDNRELLEAGRLSAVLYHDLRRDLHRACQLIMQAHGALDGAISTAPASIQVITPFNIPPENVA